jgi:1-acyl-sn-glycerol-3-phosphate acyltransferase
MQQLRSAIYTALLFLTTAFFAIVVILLMWLPPEAHYTVPRAWARTNLWLLKRVCGLDYQVEGRENLPQRPFISMWKHSSTWDTIAQMIIVPRAAWLIKREILWIPLLGWAVARFKPIAIDRKAGGSAVNQVVSQGKSVSPMAWAW